MRKYIALFLALAMLLSFSACAAEPAVSAPSPAVDSVPVRETGTFVDVSVDADYAEAVEWCYQQKLMNGVGGNKFDPEGTLTRATLATVLYRDAGQPTVYVDPYFSDAKAKVWYSNAVVWADARGILQGYGNNVFGVDDPVSQEMLEVVLERYLGGEGAWKGDPAKAASATRAQIAVALMAALKRDPGAEGGKVLVACFSCTNNTMGVAEKIAAKLGAELYAITPEVPYTAEDLDYNSDCRANSEQNDPSARPAIHGAVKDWESYDVVFLGYPIWWGVPPKIIHTFLESYDFAGKTVIPFCTSGSSPYSDSGIRSLVGSGATWITGRRFAASATQAAVEEWVNSLDLDKEEAAVSTVNVSFNGHDYTATLADNSSAVAFASLLKKEGGSIVIDAHDYGNFEKVGDLPESLPRNDAQITTVPGDIILYLGTEITVYYAENSWNFTRLGHLDGDLSNLKEHLGDGNVSITFSLPA